MCKECGYIVCIECFNELSQMSVEKRKSKYINEFLEKKTSFILYWELKRTCIHHDSYWLSEFIPWNSKFNELYIHHWTKV